MEKFELTKLSSKGQVVLPLAIRRQLKLVAGVKFVVMGDRDTIVLKRIEKPSLDRARALLERSREWAKRAGLTKRDVKDAIREARGCKG